jgi:hypothetical protein
MEIVEESFVPTVFSTTTATGRSSTTRRGISASDRRAS